MKTSEAVVLFIVIVLAVFAALIGWTLIVKQQVTATLATEQSANPILAALTSL
jgi:hypothetical protein